MKYSEMKTDSGFSNDDVVGDLTSSVQAQVQNPTTLNDSPSVGTYLSLTGMSTRFKVKFPRRCCSLQTLC